MNLFQRYLLITESTENFKKWFGKSILHTDGKPHQFYHGGGDDIHSFSHDHVGKGADAHGSGFYFTNKPDVASNYASGDGKGTKSPNVVPVHLKLTKPIDPESKKTFSRDHVHKLLTSAPNHHEALQNFGDVDREGYRKVLRGAVDSYAELSKMHAMNAIHNDFYRDHTSELLKNVTKITGHDGVMVKNDDHVIVNVFHPNQIKSSVGNRGTYSKKSDNITEGDNA